ncbi:hypothetical protein NLG97_g8262 [Lecanicillium saksenae]|uniref:Uncharacterized protein n=1 Tax=Lecanicillium saksenae TaxID=468837 RepID=A0ACC1QKS7_9HYPO|nr:hypothetical protein NLG97_g8262 [Lecanicillium saksenae]
MLEPVLRQSVKLTAIKIQINPKNIIHSLQSITMKFSIIATTLLSAAAAATLPIEPTESAVEARKVTPMRGAAGHVAVSLWSVAGVAVAGIIMA